MKRLIFLLSMVLVYDGTEVIYLDNEYTDEIIVYSYDDYWVDESMPHTEPEAGSEENASDIIKDIECLHMVLVDCGK